MCYNSASEGNVQLYPHLGTSLYYPAPNQTERLVKFRQIRDLINRKISGRGNSIKRNIFEEVDFWRFQISPQFYRS